MDKIINIILIVLISLNGVFFYKGYFDTPFRFSQYAFFIFSVGILGSCLLYKKNKWIGLLSALASFGFFRSYALQHTYSIETLFQEFIGGALIFLLYYIVRELNIKEDKLKWILIPAILNIALLWIQKFDMNLLNFIRVTPKVTGFLGNPSLTIAFLCLTTPIFIKYIPKMIPILFLTGLMCESRIPLLALLVSMLVYYKFTNIKAFRVWGFVLCLFIGFLIFNLVIPLNGKCLLNNNLFGKAWFKERLSMQVGALDGISKNPILGWGLGSFIPIVSQIKEEDSYYCGQAFNSRVYSGANKDKNPAIIMNHPHNEYLYGWWNFGIMWVVLLIFLIRDTIRKFKEECILSFSILIGAFTLALGYFFTYPVWMIVALTLGIYHNMEVSHG